MARERVCSLSDVKEGELRSFKVGERDVVIIAIGGKITSFDRWCTHEQGDMSEGSIEGSIVTCPLHGSKFDVAHGGKNLVGPDEEPGGTVPDIQVFPVIVEGNDVFVQL